jgi:AcrR family transcriptional regulator
MTISAECAERSKILEAAYRCLMDNNGAGASVNGILAEAGLSTRAFYRHFDSKDALFLAMFRRDSERVHAELTDLAGAAPAPRDALRRWIEGFLALTADPRRRRRVLVMSSEELMRTTGYAAERARMSAEHRRTIAAILARGRADGSLPWAEPEADAGMIMAALTQAFQDLMTGAVEDSAHEAAEQLTSFTFRALGASVAARA